MTCHTFWHKILYITKQNTGEDAEEGGTLETVSLLPNWTTRLRFKTKLETGEARRERENSVSIHDPVKSCVKDLVLQLYFYFFAVNVFQIIRYLLLRKVEFLQIERVIPVIFHHNIRFANGPCSGANGMNGTCYTEQECDGRGGANSGTCAAGFGVCCLSKEFVLPKKS